LVGSRLSMMLKERGYQVWHLSRQIQENTSFPRYFWNPQKNEIDFEVLNSCDYLIHLAGENIGKGRWTPKRRKAILDSRILSAETLFKNLAPDYKLKAFITASAIGYYGAVTVPGIFEEKDPPGNDFSAQVCQQWEAASDHFSQKGIRTVKVRIGLVLSAEGGVLSRLGPLIKMGLGAPIGSGRQFMPWIHIDDLCEIFIKSIEDEEIVGAYNAVAPEHVNNSDFTKIIAKSLKKPFWLPNIPGLIMKLRFGRMSAILLNGSRISSRKIVAAGFSFKFPKLEEALKQVYSL